MKAPTFIAFYIAKGADAVFQGTHWTGPDKLTPVNLNGWTILVKAKRKDGTIILNNVPAAILGDGSTGQYTWTMTHAQSNVASGLCSLDIFRTDTGVETPLVIGTLQIGADVRWGS